MNSRMQMSKADARNLQLQIWDNRYTRTSERDIILGMRKHNGDRSREIMKAMCVAFAKLN